MDPTVQPLPPSPRGQDKQGHDGLDRGPTAIHQKRGEEALGIGSASRIAKNARVQRCGPWITRERAPRLREGVEGARGLCRNTGGRGEGDAAGVPEGVERGLGRVGGGQCQAGLGAAWWPVQEDPAGGREAQAPECVRMQQRPLHRHLELLLLPRRRGTHRGKGVPGQRRNRTDESRSTVSRAQRGRGTGAGGTEVRSGP